MRRDGAAHFLPSRTKGKGVHAALPPLNLAFRGIARGAIAGLSAAVFIGTAVLAQAPRSVTILPDVPEAPEAAPAPNISPMRLELLNSTVKVENPAGVSVDLIPKLEVSAGSKIGFRIAAKKTGAPKPACSKSAVDDLYLMPTCAIRRRTSSCATS